MVQCHQLSVKSVKNKCVCLVWVGRFGHFVFRKMDEEDSLDGMDDEESKNPLAFLGLQRFKIKKSLLYLYCICTVFASRYTTVLISVF